MLSEKYKHLNINILKISGKQVRTKISKNFTKYSIN
jgi:hypothetical protein